MVPRRYSPLSPKAGGAITTLSGRIRLWATNHLLQKSRYGRLRNPDQLRRPPQQ